ncbi:MAG: hypothetical protein ABR499_13570 [Gemmatimonadaceae bacterium]
MQDAAGADDDLHFVRTTPRGAAVPHSPPRHTMFSPNHPDARAAAHDPQQVLARFWASVDGRESAESCWEWRGRRSAGYPIFTVKYRSVAAARFAWFAATGDFPLGGKLRHTCRNVDCVRPDHLEWELGRRTERRLRAVSDGYVTPSDIGNVRRDYDDGPWRRRAG